jgi:hypothetical protein
MDVPNIINNTPEADAGDACTKKIVDIVIILL